MAGGEVPVLRMGKSVRIVPAQLEKWITEHSTKPQLEEDDLSMFRTKPRRRQAETQVEAPSNSPPRR